MAEYADYCDTVSSEKGYAIKTATQKISELSAEIEDSEAQIQEYADEIAAVGTALAGKEKQLSEAEAVRASEHTAFEKTEAELVTSIDELERAIHTIKKDGEEAASLVQLRGSPRGFQERGGGAPPHRGRDVGERGVEAPDPGALAGGRRRRPQAHRWGGPRGGGVRVRHWRH